MVMAVGIVLLFYFSTSLGLDTNLVLTFIVSDAPHWPDYRFNESLMVFRAGSSHTETDTWRVPQLRFWSTIWRLLKT